jgi:hypothetical protein
VLLIDQLKEAYIDADLEPIDTTNYFPKILRKDYAVALGARAPGQEGTTPIRVSTRLTCVMRKAITQRTAIRRSTR